MHEVCKPAGAPQRANGGAFAKKWNANAVYAG